MSRFRERLKKKKLYKLLQETIKSGFKTNSTDAKLYCKGIVLLGKLAKGLGIKLRQSYIRAGKKLLIKYSRHNHAKQFKRKAATLKKLKVRLGRLYREIVCKADEQKCNLDLNASILLQQCQRLLMQKRNSKNKLYSFHEPQTVCISKGKAHKRYEFGNKSTFITTAKECFILNAGVHERNLYDGHTLKQALDSANHTTKEILKSAIDYLFADKGYKGHGYTGKTTVLLKTSANKKRHKQLKRRASIEPVFSHTKQHHRMGRNFLKGSAGDLINTILSACGYNLKKIYNKFKRAYKKMLSLLLFMLFGDYMCLDTISVSIR